MLPTRVPRWLMHCTQVQDLTGRGVLIFRALVNAVPASFLHLLLCMIEEWPNVIVPSCFARPCAPISAREARNTNQRMLVDCELLQIATA